MDEQKKARAQCHPDKPAKAKGLCVNCYMAHRRAEAKARAKAQAIETGKIRVDEEMGVDSATGAVIDFPDDKAASLRLKQILWGWIETAEKAVIVTGEDGSRDYRTEVRLRDMQAQMAMRAASILGRQLIGEKREDRPPMEELPGQNLLSQFAQGWLAAATSKPTPREKAQGGRGHSDDADDFDA